MFRGKPPAEVMGLDIILGAEMVGFLDLFAFLSEIPLLSDIMLHLCRVSASVAR